MSVNICEFHVLCSKFKIYSVFHGQKNWYEDENFREVRSKTTNIEETTNETPKSTSSTPTSRTTDQTRTPEADWFLPRCVNNTHCLTELEREVSGYSNKIKVSAVTEF